MLFSRLMKALMQRRPFAFSIATTVVFSVFAGVLAVGCGDSASSASEVLEPRDLPPIDLQAPLDFQTATFAFG